MRIHLPLTALAFTMVWGGPALAGLLGATGVIPAHVAAPAAGASFYGFAFLAWRMAPVSAPQPALAKASA